MFIVKKILSARACQLPGFTSARFSFRSYAAGAAGAAGAVASSISSITNSAPSEGTVSTVDPRTGLSPRLPQLQRDQCNEEQAKIYDAVTSTRTFAQFPNGLPGPWNAMLYAPRMGGIMEQMGHECRNTETYKRHAALVEIGILMVGVEWQSQFEAFAHFPMARKAGVSEVMIEALMAKLPAEQLPQLAGAEAITAAERAVYALGRELLDTKRVGEERYAAVVEHIGTKGVVELVHTMGHYCNICITLNVFNVPLPDGAPLPFREPRAPATSSRL